MPSITTGDTLGGVSLPKPRAKGSIGVTGADAPADDVARARGSSNPSPISSNPEAFLSASSAMSNLEECLRSVRPPEEAGDADMEVDEDGDNKKGEEERCLGIAPAGEANEIGD